MKDNKSTTDEPNEGESASEHHDPWNVGIVFGP
jgi:hypothetical protein